ncbi:50S ribosomal protein L25/general stress protein Ctc [Alphaproteobacteria bacterium LSUCC0684]
MSDTMTLSASKRDRAGKGSARAARRAGLIPAVIYGDRKDPLSINLDANAFGKLISTPGIFSQILNLDVDGEKNNVLARDIQFHPVTDVPMHVDFLRIAKGATIAVSVPVVFLNEEKSPGLKSGGVLNVVRYEVEINCPAMSIPENLEVDLEGTVVGDSIHISAVSLPEGVEPTITDRDFTIATIAAPTVSSAESETAEDEGPAVDESEDDASADD